jgi:hypothetical protein
MNDNFLFSFGQKEKENLELIKEESSFHEFKVENDKVLIECYLTIKNNTENFYKFRINAIFENDVKMKLLENKILEGCLDDLETNVFTISPNETIESIKIIFIGKFGGNYRKHDRALPDIYIIVVEQNIL